MKIRTIIFLIIVIIIIAVIIWITLRSKKESYTPKEEKNDNVLSSIFAISKKYGETIVNKRGKTRHYLTKAKLNEILNSFDSKNQERELINEDNEQYMGNEGGRGPFDRYISRFGGLPGSAILGEAIMRHRYPDRDNDSASDDDHESHQSNRNDSYFRGQGYENRQNRSRNNNYYSVENSPRYNTPYDQEYRTQITTPPQQKEIPISSAGSNEERCRRILEKIFQSPFPKRRPKWLLNPETGSPMELDCYNEDLKLALEYNGKQHYKFQDRLHKTEEEYESQKRRDKYKAEICKKRGITLLTVPYTIPSRELYTYIVEELEKLDLIDVED